MFPHYSAKNLFFAELLGKTITIPGQMFWPLFIINGFLVWLIGNLLFPKKYHLIPPSVYFLSPWFYYLTFAHSFYIFLLFPILLTAYGFTWLKRGNRLSGNLFVLVGVNLAIYSSLLSVILLPILLILKRFQIFFLSILFLLPLLFLTGKNIPGFKNILNNDIPIFSDPAIVNTVNRFQGAAEREGMKTLARISENKYLFYSEYFSLKYITQIVPATFFTPQYKLLEFSFTPPIFLGFLIPFLFGLYNLLLKLNIRKYLLISSLLVIPSILTKDVVSLNRLVIFSPVVVFVIASGLISMLEWKKRKITKIFLFLTIFLVLFQLVVTLDDIKTREALRFASYFGKSYEMTEQ